MARKLALEGLVNITQVSKFLMGFIKKIACTTYCLEQNDDHASFVECLIFTCLENIVVVDKVSLALSTTPYRIALIFVKLFTC